MKNERHLERVDAHGLSIRGEDHGTNHDRFAVADLAKSLRLQHTNLAPDDARAHRREPQGQVYLVADGVSGGPAPATASSTAVRSLVEAFLHDLPWTDLISGHPADVLVTLEDAFRNVQTELQRSSWVGTQGMATTLTLAFVRWPDLFLAHVGDSRAYLARRGSVRRLTRDHSLAEVKRELGKEVAPRDEAVLWNTVGGHSSQLDPQVEHHVLQVEDTLALLTDGVVRSHGDDALHALLRAGGPAEELCGRLVSAPGVDDRTAVVARFLSEASAPVEAAPAPIAPSLRAVRRLPEARRETRAARPDRKRPRVL